MPSCCEKATWLGPETAPLRAYSDLWRTACKQTYKQKNQGPQSYNHKDVNSANISDELRIQPQAPDETTALADILRPSETLRRRPR